MNFDQINKVSWMNQINKNLMLYPDERVVAFLARNYKDLDQNDNKNALDIGFGSGRHIKLFLDYNFNTYGIDYNQGCVDIVNKLLGDNKKLKELSVFDINECEFKDDYFDVILAYGVLFLRKEEEILKDLKNIVRLLNKNGKILMNFRTKEDINYKKGKLIEENTYLLDERSGVYENMLYTFLDIDEVRSILSKANIEIEKEERIDYYKDSLTEKNSWWIITAKKKI